MEHARSLGKLASKKVSKKAKKLAENRIKNFIDTSTPSLKPQQQVILIWFLVLFFLFIIFSSPLRNIVLKVKYFFTGKGDGVIESKGIYESKGEQETRQALFELTGEKFVTIRPSWLRNPETGKNLEIDCWCEKFKLAVEFDGIQHFKFNQKFHGTEEQFVKQQCRDLFKEQVCLMRGVIFIRVPHNSIGKVKAFLKERLPSQMILSNTLNNQIHFQSKFASQIEK